MPTSQSSQGTDEESREELREVAREELRRISQLRFQLLEAHPFWGHLLLQIRLLPAPRLPSFAATDCVSRVWFNPQLTRHLDLAQLGFVLMHELGHIALLSGVRRCGRDPHLWNCATDYAINRMVSSMNSPSTGRPLYRSPDGHYPELGEVRILDDPKWTGMVAETIYEQLASEPGAGGQELVVELGTGEVRIPVRRVLDHGGGIDVHLPAQLGPEEQEQIEEALERALGAWESSGRRGDAPGDLIRRTQAEGRGSLGWAAILRSVLMRSLGRPQWDRRRSDRRLLELGAWAPRVRPTEESRLVVAVDTSGSMDLSILRQCLEEVRGLVCINPKITLVVADSKVQEVIESHALPAYLRAGRLRGGGGTDHRPVFRWVEEQGAPPDLMIAVTDLFSRFPKEAPNYPVLWVVPQHHAPAPWGRVLELPKSASL